jgi:hypothetical protein
VHRIVPAEGYTWSDQEHIGKGQESSDRIDRGDHDRGESPAKRLISGRSIRGRYLTWRSVTYRLRPITSNNTTRKKVLQTGALMRARAMRSVFCWVLRHGSSSNPLARSSPDHRGAFQAALNAFVAEERAREDLGGLTGPTSLQNGLYPHRGQADRASLEPPGVESPDYPRLHLIHSAAPKEWVAAE